MPVIFQFQPKLKETTMEFSDFVRRPFAIQAVQITDENMEELCGLIGHEIKEKGTSRFIVVNRRIVPQGNKAYVGWWVTQMGDNLRCYPNRIFTQQFVPMTDEWTGWFTEDEDEADEMAATPVEPEAVPSDAPQIGDTFVQDVVEPYTGE
jgi:hypothetical protein